MKVNCVIVTYNRLALLKECLAAIEKQTYPTHRIIVIDNRSADGTEEYLKAYAATRPQVRVVRTERNIGGAGGFSLGLKTSVLGGGDYTWMMDDDTIPAPNALEALVRAAAQSGDVGFVCSKVLWTDGTPHVMNRPGGADSRSTGGACRCLFCSFVSVLIRSEAVRKVGLPIKEFFIWCDDIEYTSRITDSGYRGYYAADSVVTHKSSENYYPSVDKAPPHTAGRFYYQARNTCYIKHRRTKSKIIFYFSVWNKLRVQRRRIKRRKDGHGQEFWEAVKKGCRDGLTFYPEIEYLP